MLFSGCTDTNDKNYDNQDEDIDENDDMSSIFDDDWTTVTVDDHAGLESIQ